MSLHSIYLYDRSKSTYDNVLNWNEYLNWNDIIEFIRLILITRPKLIEIYTQKPLLQLLCDKLAWLMASKRTKLHIKQHPYP